MDGNVIIAIVVGISVGLLVPTIIGSARWLWHRFEAKLEENKTTTDAILAQTLKTNGRVTALELDMAYVKGAQSERQNLVAAASAAANILTHPEGTHAP